MSAKCYETTCNHWKLISKYNGYIPFTYNDILYQIRTDYYYSYPQAIHTKLQELNYTIPDNKYIPYCNWYIISTAYHQTFPYLNTEEIDVQISFNTGLPLVDINVIGQV